MVTVPTFWLLVTRLGEAQILLPTALLAGCALLPHAEGRRLAAWWTALLAFAVGLTTASKVAFIGWGLGSPQLDFTGVSGHAMFAAAVYPLVFGAMAPARARVHAVTVGALLALLVGVSRVPVHAHSVSEVVAGLALGGAVPAVALARARLVVAAGRLRLALPALAVAWLSLLPAYAPASQSHAIVTRLALKLAGHERPYRRDEWLREWQQRQPVVQGPGPRLS